MLLGITLTIAATKDHHNHQSTRAVALSRCIALQCILDKSNP
jgi:hypothetical protein